MQFTVPILSNIQVADQCFMLTFEAPLDLTTVNPCQFLTISLPDISPPFIKKPFSIYHFDPKTRIISIIYRVIGKGTANFSRQTKDKRVTVLAPLGNGIKPSELPPGKLAFVAGGIGIASLNLISQHISEFDLYYGARTQTEFIDLPSWNNRAMRVFLSTDDHSVGHPGVITEVLKLDQYTGLIACGPHIMLKKVSELCKKIDLPHWVILEEYMACGMGVCMGCVVNTTSGYQRVCKEGPVFNGTDIIW